MKIKYIFLIIFLFICSCVNMEKPFAVIKKDFIPAHRISIATGSHTELHYDILDERWETRRVTDYSPGWREDMWLLLLSQGGAKTLWVSVSRNQYDAIIIGAETPMVMYNELERQEPKEYLL